MTSKHPTSLNSWCGAVAPHLAELEEVSRIEPRSGALRTGDWNRTRILSLASQRSSFKRIRATKERSCEILYFVCIHSRAFEHISVHALLSTSATPHVKTSAMEMEELVLSFIAFYAYEFTNLQVEILVDGRWISGTPLTTSDAVVEMSRVSPERQLAPLLDSLRYSALHAAEASGATPEIRSRARQDDLHYVEATIYLKDPVFETVDEAGAEPPYLFGCRVRDIKAWRFRRKERAKDATSDFEPPKWQEQIRQ